MQYIESIAHFILTQQFPTPIDAIDIVVRIYHHAIAFLIQLSHTAIKF